MGLSLYALGCLLFLAISVTAQHPVGHRHYEGRALRATPYGPSPSKFPKFKYTGGPPDAAGVWTNDAGICLHTGYSFVSTYYVGNGNPFQNQYGRYLSWECTSLEGVYIATVLRKDTYNNGTVVVQEHCEVAKVQDGTYFWTSSTTECPDPQTAEFPSDPTNLFLVPSTALPGAASLICTGTEGSGANNNGPAAPPRTMKRGTVNGAPLPPALEPADFPPVFPRSGGPQAASGVWFSDSATIGNLISTGGMISSVALKGEGAEDMFTATFARYNSYECGDGGAVKASFSFSTISGDKIKVSSAVGCTTAAVDLEEGTYSWTLADPETCPGYEYDVEMGRVQDGSTL